MYRGGRARLQAARSFAVSAEQNHFASQNPRNSTLKKNASTTALVPSL